MGINKRENKMNIHIVQIIFLLTIFLFAGYVFVLRNELIDRIIYLILICIGISLVLFPNLSTKFANLIGIGRGVDLLLYLLIFFNLFHYVNLSVKFKKIDNQITSIVKHIAHNNVIHGSKKQKNQLETRDK